MRHTRREVQGGGDQIKRGGGEWRRRSLSGWFVPSVSSPELNRYSSAYIGPLRNEDFCITGNRRREWLRDDVQQNFAHLAGARSDGVSLLILKQVNLALKVQWKDHRFRAHLFHSAPPALTRGELIQL
jgi:hypothetical protein